MERDPKTVSYTMSRIKGRDTKIEMKIRRGLKEHGISYRVCSKDVFGHPDILIRDCRIAIFCDSEFWHGYHFEEASKNIHTHEEYWIPKIRRNMERDEEVNRVLKEQGYLVLRYWGFEIDKEYDRVLQDILSHIVQRKEVLSRKKPPYVRTTLVYVEQDGKYLMLYRNKKKQDLNEGKWVGVGGHLEGNESPAACMKREVYEETGLTVTGYRYYGKVYFLNSKYPAEVMYLYKVTGFEGDVKECNEGELSWIPIEDVPNLPLWDGDRIFLPLIGKDTSPFELVLGYDGDILLGAIGPSYKNERSKHGKRKPKRK